MIPILILEKLQINIPRRTPPIALRHQSFTIADTSSAYAKYYDLFATIDM